MSALITLPSLDTPVLNELRRCYDEASNAETRTRYQMILLATSGHNVPQIACLVLRSEDTVARVLKRFITGGLDAVPRRTSPGRARTITQEWEGELLRVIELDPHEVGVLSANWTTQLLTDYLGKTTGITVTQETVRVYLHALGYGGLAPDVDLTAQSRRESGLRGKKTAGRGGSSRSHSI